MSILSRFGRYRPSRPYEVPVLPRRCWQVEIFCADMTGTQIDELFDRVAEAAHALDEQVSVSSKPSPDCDCCTSESP